MTHEAPAAMALAMSPEKRMPPSAMTGTPRFGRPPRHFMMAVSCGTPTPATMRVVQMEPGPMPTLTASAPASISASVASAVATLPAATCTRFDSRLMRATASITRDEWPCAVSTTIRSQPASIRRSVRVEAIIADGRRGGDPEAALVVLAGVRMVLGLLDVLHRDQPDAMIALVDDDQLLDAVLMQQAFGLLAVDLGADRDEAVLGHQLGDGLALVGREADVAIGEHADELAVAGAVAGTLDDGDAGDLVGAHQVERVGERGGRVDGHWIDDHARLEFLHHGHLLGLLGGLEISVDDADAAGLGDRDGELALGHRVHGRGENRDVDRDLLGDAGGDVGLSRQHLGAAGDQQHVVEGEADIRLDDGRARAHAMISFRLFGGLRMRERPTRRRCGRQVGENARKCQLLPSPPLAEP